jgi:hypothetical protein
MSFKTIFDRLQTIDRRILYWILIIALMLPYIRPLGLPITISSTTRALYEELEVVQPGDVCLLSINLGVGSWPDCLPSMVACVKMLLRQEAKIIVWSIDAGDVDITWDKLVSQVPELEHYSYGEDYVFFGYIPGQEANVALLGSNIRGLLTLDKYGNHIDDLPIMKEVNGAEDFRLAVSSDSGLDWINWYIQQWHTSYGTPIGSIGVSVLGSLLMPYFRSGEIFGMSVGSRGGAELESLIKAPGEAIQSMDSISLSHLLVVVPIILANIGYFVRRRIE